MHNNVLKSIFVRNKIELAVAFISLPVSSILVIIMQKLQALVYTFSSIRYSH